MIYILQIEYCAFFGWRGFLLCCGLRLTGRIPNISGRLVNRCRIRSHRTTYVSIYDTDRCIRKQASSRIVLRHLGLSRTTSHC